MLPIIHEVTERGKRFRSYSPRGSHSHLAATARRPGKGRRKGYVNSGSFRGSSTDGLEKLTYVSTLLSSKEKEQLQHVLLGNTDILALSHSDMTGIDPTLASHKLNVIAMAKLVRQKIRRFHPDRHQIIQT